MPSIAYTQGILRILVVPGHLHEEGGEEHIIFIYQTDMLDFMEVHWGIPYLMKIIFFAITLTFLSTYTEYLLWANSAISVSMVVTIARCVPRLLPGLTAWHSHASQARKLISFSWGALNISLMFWLHFSMLYNNIYVAPDNPGIYFSKEKKCITKIFFPWILERQLILDHQ
jgi:hypothetical protein